MSADDLQDALDAIERYHKDTPDALRGDDHLVRALTELEAAKVYHEAAREALENDGPE